MPPEWTAPRWIIKAAGAFYGFDVGASPIRSAKQMVLQIAAECLIAIRSSPGNGMDVSAGPPGAIQNAFPCAHMLGESNGFDLAGRGASRHEAHRALELKVSWWRLRCRRRLGRNHSATLTPYSGPDYWASRPCGSQSSIGLPSGSCK